MNTLPPSATSTATDATEPVVATAAKIGAPGEVAKLPPTEQPIHDDGFDDDAVAKLIAELKIPDEAASEIRPTLVLIDANGMLFYKDKAKECRHATTLKHFVGGTGKGVANFYVRPGAMELIAKLATDPRVKFAVYTSMKRHNVVGILQAFDAYQMGEAKKSFSAFHCGDTVVSTPSSIVHTAFDIFDQDFNRPDPQPGDQYGFKRDLTKVWAHPKVKAAGFGPHNTLLIEGEATKSRDFRGNTLQPAEFTAAGVKASGANDTTLATLGAQLEQLFTYMQSDNEDMTAVPIWIAKRATR